MKCQLIRVRLVVGTAIAGQTFYLFTLENLKQFGSLKAMGVSNARLIGMVMLSVLAFQSARRAWVGNGSARPGDEHQPHLTTT